jgi:hypothetical protein
MFICAHYLCDGFLYGVRRCLASRPRGPSPREESRCCSGACMRRRRGSMMTHETRGATQRDIERLGSWCVAPPPHRSTAAQSAVSMTIIRAPARRPCTGNVTGTRCTGGRAVACATFCVSVPHKLASCMRAPSISTHVSKCFTPGCVHRLHEARASLPAQENTLMPTAACPHCFTFGPGSLVSL